MNIQSSPKG